MQHLRSLHSIEIKIYFILGDVVSWVRLISQLLKTLLFHQLFLSYEVQLVSAPVSHLFTFGSLLTSCYYLVFHSLVLLDGVFCFKWRNEFVSTFSRDSFLAYSAKHCAFFFFFFWRLLKQFVSKMSSEADMWLLLSEMSGLHLLLFALSIVNTWHSSILDITLMTHFL